MAPPVRQRRPPVRERQPFGASHTGGPRKRTPKGIDLRPVLPWGPAPPAGGGGVAVRHPPGRFPSRRCPHPRRWRSRARPRFCSISIAPLAPLCGAVPARGRRSRASASIRLLHGRHAPCSACQCPAALLLTEHCAAQPAARGCAGPHRENWLEVGVPVPARRSAWWHGRHGAVPTWRADLDVGVPVPASRASRRRSLRH